MKNVFDPIEQQLDGVKQAAETLPQEPKGQLDGAIESATNQRPWIEPSAAPQVVDTLGGAT